MRFLFPGLLVAGVLIAISACGDSSGTGGSSPPTATIIAPPAGATYHGGQVIQFSGSAVDGDGNPLPAAALSWWAELHHDTHTHPFMPVTTGESGQVQVPTAGEVSANVFYRFYLRAVANGVADTVHQDVLPETADITITTVPGGLTITLDGQPHTAPYTVTGVVGLDRQIGVPDPQSSPDSNYSFQSWSDGGAAIHVVSTPATSTTYTATLVATGAANKPPTVSINSPADNATVPVNTATTVSATAADPDGTVTQVDFFDDGTSLGVDSSSPYSVSWTPTTAGAHSLTARATDDAGALTTSAVVSVNVSGGSGDTQNPAITLDNPVDGDLDLTGSVTATATATDNVGVVGVEFQLDGVKLGEDLTAPYAMPLPPLTNYTTGVHQVRARARDAAGNASPWARARVTFGGSVNHPSGFSVAQYGGTLNGQGTAMAFAPDGRLFVCDQGGDLRVYNNGSLLTTPFVHVSTTADGERGLLGVAFDPQFSSNHFVYLYYTVGTGSQAHNRISRFTASGDVAVGGSEAIIVELPQLSSATNHNGGAIHFGPDGKLYVAVGDNNTGTDAQSTTSLFGKILRYNSDGTIPADNPNLGAGSYKAIWAMGLRNPFTFAFQQGTTRLFINDVGEMIWEEINQGTAGANYGWPDTEGATSNPAFTSPVFTYKHGNVPPTPPSLVTGEAIVGAAFYNPGTVLFPQDYVGDYFFADYVEGWINRLDLAAGNDAVYAFARLPNSVTDLAVGPDGRLYVLAIQSNGSWGVTRFSTP